MVQTATKVPVRSEGNGNAHPSILHDWRPFEGLRQEVERVFDNFSLGTWRGSAARSLFDVGPLWSSGKSLTTPAVDVVETKKTYEITAELPGLDSKDVEVKFARNTLTIKGEKKEEIEEKKKDYYVSERRYGSFQRSLQVPEDVEADKIEASFEKGVLTVILPKTAKAQDQEKKIAITAK